MRLAGGTLIACGLGVGMRPSPCEAQISPGELSRSHASLEGNQHCARCHAGRRGLTPERCLACHGALRERVAAGRGLHARPEYADCKRCHVEHQGAGFDLVWWGKAGRAAFDHALTGHALEGKHAGLACETCHADRFRRLTWKPADGVNGMRSYLGLETACSACHGEPHRATRLGGRACLACHTQGEWKPAAGFDHATTGYALTGRHVPLACGACHTLRPGERARCGDIRAGVRECSACHADAHRQKLGPACSTCHSTAGWARVDNARFDHDRTDYPLRGRHTGLACGACHAAGGSRRPGHAACTDCHADAHQGQLARRADRGRCEACHDVAGWSPARFALEEHGATRYPLEGAHLAVACDACHRRGPRAPTATRAAVAGRHAARPALLLRFASIRCQDCHRDPHEGDLALARAGGCESCHQVAGWRKLAFDHSRTRFALAGGHAQPGCADCHKPLEPSSPRARLRLSGLPLACEACHRDPHQGQFAPGAATDGCESCHARDDVRASKFDHARDSAWPLDGAHARVACGACHKRETRDGAEFVRYKPLGKACRDCHAASQTAS